MSFWERTKTDEEYIRKYKTYKSIIKKVWLIFLVLLLGVLVYRQISYRIPITNTGYNVGEYKIYCLSYSRLVYCDRMVEYVVYEDDEFEYVLDTMSIPTCSYKVYIWEGFSYYSLDEAITEGFITIDDLLELEIAFVREKVDE